MLKKSTSLLAIAGLGLIMAAGAQAGPADHGASGEHRMQQHGTQMQQHGMQGKMQGRMQHHQGADQVASATPSVPGAGHQHGMRGAEKRGQGDAHQHGDQGRHGAHTPQGSAPAQP